MADVSGVVVEGTHPTGLTSDSEVCEHCEFNDCAECEERQFGPCCCGSLPAEWDCGSGRCDPNTGCPACTERDSWTRAR